MFWSLHFCKANRKTKYFGRNDSTHALSSTRLSHCLKNIDLWSHGSCTLGVEICIFVLSRQGFDLFGFDVVHIDKWIPAIWMNRLPPSSSYNNLLPWRWSGRFLRNIDLYRTAVHHVALRISSPVIFRFRPELKPSVKAFSMFSRFHQFCLFLDHSVISVMDGFDEFKASDEPVIISAVLFCIWPPVT